VRASRESGVKIMAPQKILALLQQALAHHRVGQLVEAEKLYARVRAVAPRNFDVFNLSGFLALQQKRYADAVALLERGLRLDGRSAQCALRLAHALKALGRHGEAREAARRAATLEPGNADAHFCLGELAAVTDGFAAAVPHFRRVAELQPQAADGWANLGVALAQSGGGEEALECFARATTLEPGNTQALTGRALVLQQSHRPSEAAAAYAEVLKREPLNFQAWSARLLTLHYLDDVSRETLLAEHVAFGRRVAEAKGRAAVAFGNSAEPERRLRVAFLSPDLRGHSVAFFLRPLLERMDRARFELVLYHDHPTIDAVSAQLRSLASAWRHVAGWPDERVEAAIRADAPDVLIDLAGHTGLNRLPLFQRRLAPVQITCLGYPDTTGVAEMDYRFTDAVADPVGGAERFCTEKLVRFAPVAWAYAPPEEAPEPARSGERGAVTFGCFNNFSKVSGATLRLWAAVLEAVPGSRLLIKSSGLERSELPRVARERLAGARIDLERVTLLGRVSGTAAHLAIYGQIDVALDTFPYHGTTTTCEALWMGVPVVTLAGDRHMSRVGASLLRAAGHPEWVADSAATYVEIAARLASDENGRRAWRSGLREEMRRSALLDHAGQAARFGEAVRDCWRAWCAGGTAAPAKSA